MRSWREEIDKDVGRHSVETLEHIAKYSLNDNARISAIGMIFDGARGKAAQLHTGEGGAGPIEFVDVLTGVPEHEPGFGDWGREPAIEHKAVKPMPEPLIPRPLPSSPPFARPDSGA